MRNERSSKEVYQLLKEQDLVEGTFNEFLEILRKRVRESGEGLKLGSEHLSLKGTCSDALYRLLEPKKNNLTKDLFHKIMSYATGINEKNVGMNYPLFPLD